MVAKDMKYKTEKNIGGKEVIVLLKTVIIISKKERKEINKIGVVWK